MKPVSTSTRLAQFAFGLITLALLGATFHGFVFGHWWGIVGLVLFMASLIANIGLYLGGEQAKAPSGAAPSSVKRGLKSEEVVGAA